MATRKATTPKTTRKKTTKPNPARVCVLACENGENLILRSNPTVSDVQGFVGFHHSRDRDAPDTVRVMSATFFESEYDIDDLKLAGEQVDLSDLVPGDA